VVPALSERTTIVCLADPDHRILDHIEGVDEHRLERCDPAARLADSKTPPVEEEFGDVGRTETGTGTGTGTATV
jgi:hypothetical protein